MFFNNIFSYTHDAIFVVLQFLMYLSCIQLRSTKLLALVSKSTACMDFGRSMAHNLGPETCGKPEDVMTTPYSVTYITIDDADKAEALARLLVDKKLAACVNIIPKISSIYRWEGQVTKDEELLMMIKSRQTRLEELTETIKANHPYKVCEVISLPVRMTL